MAGTYTQKIETATPAESVAALVARLDAAMTAIAKAAGAWACEFCGSWTVEDVAVELEDTSGRVWIETQCPRCAGAR